MRILLIRLRLIGDVVFTTPVIRALRRLYPDAHLAYLVEPLAAPVVVGNPHLDDVIVAPDPRAPGRIAADVALARRLRRGRYDVVFDLHGGPRSALLAWATGARRRVGYAVAGRRWLYTERVARPRVLRARHSVQNQWDLLSALGIAAPDRERDRTEMAVAPAAVASVAAKLGSVGLAPGHQPLIVVHVSAGNPFRRWPASAFVTLLTRLVEHEPRRRILVVSGPSEQSAARSIGAQARSALGPLGGAIVDDLEFDLAELRALMDVAALFVGGDSGPLHVAGTSNVPVVGLYGPTLAARSAPWRPGGCVTESVEWEELACRPCNQRRCAPGDFRCLAGLPADRVATAAERTLARSHRS